MRFDRSGVHSEALSGVSAGRMWRKIVAARYLARTAGSNRGKTIPMNSGARHRDCLPRRRGSALFCCEVRSSAGHRLPKMELAAQ
jgi:hypothetical protein